MRQHASFITCKCNAQCEPYNLQLNKNCIEGKLGSLSVSNDSAYWVVTSIPRWAEEMGLQNNVS